MGNVLSSELFHVCIFCNFDSKYFYALDMKSIMYRFETYNSQGYMQQTLLFYCRRYAPDSYYAESYDAKMRNTSRPRDS